MLLTERKSLYSSSDTSSGDEDCDASESSKSGEFPHFVFCRDEAMNKIILVLDTLFLLELMIVKTKINYFLTLVTLIKVVREKKDEGLQSYLRLKC
jgi:hypothetical protein